MKYTYNKYNRPFVLIVLNCIEDWVIIDYERKCFNQRTDKTNVRPLSTIRPRMNESYQMVTTMQGLI